MARHRHFTPHASATRWQVRAYEVLFGKTPGDTARQIVDIGITALVLTSIIAIVLESMPALHDRFHREFHAFEVFSIAVFTMEYLARLWCVPAGKANLTPMQARIQYAKSFHGLIDLCATLPFYLQAFYPELDLRFMRAVRMLRFLKLSHYSTALEDLFRAIRDEHESFISALYILGIAILMTSCLAYYAEHDVQPDKFGSIPDAMWWSIITLTTVGYGDVAPITPFGKLIGVATALMGVCTVALLTGIVASSFANQMARKRAIFEAELIKALQDGHLSSEEEEMLEHLRQTFNLTQEHANAIVKRVKQEHGSGKS
ncbi:MAG: hypothetical protein RL676_863 [Pseudomonadota bacterium]